jgi:hypothetical protein
MALDIFRPCSSSLKLPGKNSRFALGPFPGGRFAAAAWYPKNLQCAPAKAFVQLRIENLERKENEPFL